jgi:hypothetical protein
VLSRHARYIMMHAQQVFNTLHIYNIMCDVQAAMQMTIQLTLFNSAAMAFHGWAATILEYYYYVTKHTTVTAAHIVN